MPTLVYRIEVQDQINVQVAKFLENIKRAGPNRRAGWKFSGKSINVQGGHFLANQYIIMQVIFIFETEKVIVKFILTFLLTYLSQI